jgi:hypothetical protein
MYELLQLASYRRILAFLDRIKKEAESEDGKKPELSSTQLFYYLATIFYYLWIFAGLLSSQWVLFFVMLVLGLIPKGKWLFVRYVDSIISIALLIFIMLNKYHLHIDLFHIIKTQLF